MKHFILFKVYNTLIQNIIVMQTQVSGTSNYKILTAESVFWEYDFNKAKMIYDNFKSKKKVVKIILEQWEGEIGGTGVHSEEILFD